MTNKKKKFPIAIAVAVVLLLAVAGWGWSVWVRIYESAPPPSENGETEPPVVDPEPEKNILNVLILGIDQLEHEPARADTIMVMSINQDTDEVALISIPRDARVEIPGRGMDKINHAMAYKGELRLMISTVEKLLGVPMHHYVYTNFAGFTRIIDTLGGVTINVEKAMYHESVYLPIDLQPGVQDLNGAQALSYVRYRGDGDFNRMLRQQNFLKAVASETLKPATFLKLPVLLEQIARHVRTDMSITQLLSFSRTASEIELDELNTVMIQGNPINVNGVSYVQLDDDHLQETIRRFLHWEADEDEEEPIAVSAH